jgi:hypothetical protein
MEETRMMSETMKSVYVMLSAAEAVSKQADDLHEQEMARPDIQQDICEEIQSLSLNISSVVDQISTLAMRMQERGYK